MILGIDTIASNLGVSFEVMITMSVLFAGFLFYAVDFKLGSVIHFIGFGLIFLWFYNWSQSNPTISWWLPLTLMFVFLIVMSFALYPASNSQVNRGFA